MTQIESDLKSYPALQRLANSSVQIAAEVSKLDRSDVAHHLNRIGKTHDEVAVQLIELAKARNGIAPWIPAWGDDPDKWLNLGLLIRDRALVQDSRIAETTKLLSHLRGIKVAALSLFKPGALLRVHRHPELVRENVGTFHLGLLGPPEGAYLCVNGEFIREEMGKAFVFDGGKPHFAFNASHEDRIILYIEFFRDRLAWV